MANPEIKRFANLVNTLEDWTAEILFEHRVVRFYRKQADGSERGFEVLFDDIVANGSDATLEQYGLN